MARKRLIKPQRILVDDTMATHMYICMYDEIILYVIHIYIYTYTCATHRYITGDSRENPDLKPSFPVQAAIGGLEIPMAMGQQLSGNGRCLSTDFPPEN